MHNNIHFCFTTLLLLGRS